MGIGASVAASALLAAAAQGCEIHAGSLALETTSYRLGIVTEPARIDVGRFFVVRLQLCPKDGASPPDTVRIDAHMPAHRHGMNYLPRVTADGAGFYRADGFLFHMAGAWEFVVDLQRGASSERATAARRVE